MLIDIFGSEEPALKGKIKSRQIFENNKPRFSHYYDEDGFEVERVFYKNGQIDQFFKLYADENGYRVTADNYFGKNEVVICKLNEFRKPTYLHGVTIEYDENGRVTKEIRYCPDGNLEEVTIYKYFDNGKEEELIYYRPDGSFDSPELTRYDENDNIIESDDGYEKISYGYDFNNNLLSETRVNNHNNKIIEETDYEYDDNGNVIYWSSFEDKHGFGHISHYEYELDDQNRILTTIETDGDEDMISHLTYAYDDVGNIIKEIKKEYHDRERTTIQEFKIVYY